MALSNPSAEVPANINISAYRVLFILLMLVRYKSLNSRELNRLLMENPRIQRHYNPETLTKYINTLREVGCMIPRSTSRNDYSYDLVKNPFPLALEPAEFQVATKLLHQLVLRQDEQLYQDYHRLLGDVVWAIGIDAPDGVVLDLDKALALPVHVVRRCNQWQLYRRYCREGFVLEIEYQDGELIETVRLEPHEVVDRHDCLFLSGLDRNTQKQRLLSAEWILSARQLPTKNQRPASQMVVTFVLYGRLAKSYRLYPDEKVVYQSDTELQIKTSVSDWESLMMRLLKYGAACQVLSPEPLRDSMRQHIGTLLAALQGTDGHYEQS